MVRTSDFFRLTAFAFLVMLMVACDRRGPTSPAVAPPSLTSPSTPPNLPTIAPTLARATPASQVPTSRSSPGATVSPVANAPTPAPLAAPRLVGYFFGADKNYHVSDIAPDKLTQVIYAFVDVSESGECASMDASTDAANLPALRQLKQQHPRLQLLMSVGGYSHSGKFSDVALTADSRRRFAQSCIVFMRENGFEGIDVDWEYPVSGGVSSNTHRPEDRQNFTALLGELRTELDAQGARDGMQYLLTIAGPAGPSEIENIDLGAIQPLLDWINLEAYAFYTASSKTTNFNAPLFASSTDPAKNEMKRLHYNADAAVRTYLAAGVAPGKIVLGVPFYGRGWKGVPDINHGLYQSDSNAATDPEAPQGTWSDGAILYGALEKNYLNSYPRYWQGEAREPWLYSPATGIMITYEDPESLGAKAEYVVVNHLGGIMVWHVSGDDAQHSLLDAIHARLFP